MIRTRAVVLVVLSTLALTYGLDLRSTGALAQEQAAAQPAAPEAAAPEPLSEEELGILVARIALYPDELVAVIASASLYPLQIVQADRYLNDLKTKKDLKPKADWDGSVVSLLNYPEIVKMMAEDLDWTQAMGEAITNQQGDLLAAIQQLRTKAVAVGVIKTDEKIKVVKEKSNIVIQSASPEVIYVPQYEPAMLYEPDYAYIPISYYPDPYPYYYSPAAPFFAGFVTGAVWGGIVDWDDGVWGGNWGGNNWGNDININCNKCFNNADFNGNLNFNDVDWKNVDRTKINFDKTQFNNIDKTKFKNNIKANDRNSIKNKSADLVKSRPSTLPGKGTKPVKDVRASTLEGLKKADGGAAAGGKAIKDARAGSPDGVQKAGGKVAKAGQGAGNKTASGGKIDRPVGKAKAAARPDTRPKSASPLGDVGKGRVTTRQSDRGAKSMGGGMKRPVGGGGGGGKTKLPKGGGRGRG
jgi:hypothetical protein